MAVKRCSQFPQRDVALDWLTDAGWVIDSVADLDDRPGRMLVHAARVDERGHELGPTSTGY